jgi:hypothetical protein
MIIDYLNKKKIITSNLGLVWQDQQKSKWYLVNEKLIPAAESFGTAYSIIKNRNSGLQYSVLKQADRRFVFRFEAEVEHEKKEFVAKVFLLNNLRHQMKSYKYGLDEAANLLTACQRKISVPKIYGYGIQYGKYGLPKMNILILGYLKDCKTIHDLFQESEGDALKCKDLLIRTVPVFVSLYKAGCNHIDLNSGAILMHSSYEEPPILLDFHYARFHSKPSLEVLAFEMGCFFSGCSRWLAQEMQEEWMLEIFCRIQLHDNDIRQIMRAKIEAYSQVKLTRDHRKSIT